MNKKFAVIGKGFIYNLHAQAISQIGGDIASVVDGFDGSDTWREMVKNTEADCVVILAPNYLHFEMAKFSAECGKTVLCEKPLALRSEEIKILSKYPNIFTVFQLRYHPTVKKIKIDFKEDEQYQIEIGISVHRDEDYWKSWKGTEEKSGGILFNLGIHYFDLLLYLFGEPTEIMTKSLSYKIGRGKITGKNYSCDWQISAEAPKDNQSRLFKINGVNYDFAAKENLHFYVYKNLLEGKGITAPEALKSIKLIEKIYGK
jgi:UDP-N-acetyl-2-amino-2-deoxyglucuronate dehydrogenase